MYLSRDWENEFEQYKKEELRNNEYIYDDLTDRQLETVKRYFRWRTRNKYSEIVRNTSLQTLPKKAEKLANIIGNTDDWVYDGCMDTGYMGGGSCELGHALRYEHYAYSPSTGRDIIFGIKCVSDFFGIAPEQLRGITKVQDEILEEIKLIVFIMDTDKQNEYIKRYYGDIITVINTLKPNVNEIFGADWSQQMADFLHAGLPFTPSMVDRFIRVKRGPYESKAQQKKIMDMFGEDREIITDALEKMGSSPTTYVARYITGVLRNDHDLDGIEVEQNRGKKVLLLMGSALENTYNRMTNKGIDVYKLDNYSDRDIGDREYRMLSLFMFGINGRASKLDDAKILDDGNYSKAQKLLLVSKDMMDVIRWVDGDTFEDDLRHSRPSEEILDEDNYDDEPLDIRTDLEEKLDFIYENSNLAEGHWAINIALDIRKKLTRYKFELSPKQDKVVDTAYELIQEELDKKGSNGNKAKNTVKEDKDNKEYKVESVKNDPNVNRYNDNTHKIKLILENKEIEQLKENELVFKIINTIQRTGRISDRQMKHIDNAYNNIVNSMEVSEGTDDIEGEGDKPELEELQIEDGGKAAISIPSITQMSTLLGRGVLEGGEDE